MGSPEGTARGSLTSPMFSDERVHVGHDHHALAAPTPVRRHFSLVASSIDTSPATAPKSSPAAMRSLSLGNLLVGDGKDPVDVSVFQLRRNLPCEILLESWSTARSSVTVSRYFASDHLAFVEQLAVPFPEFGVVDRDVVTPGRGASQLPVNVFARDALCRTCVAPALISCSLVIAWSVPIPPEPDSRALSRKAPIEILSAINIDDGPSERARYIAGSRRHQPARQPER